MTFDDLLCELQPYDETEALRLMVMALVRQHGQAMGGSYGLVVQPETINELRRNPTRSLRLHRSPTEGYILELTGD